MDNEVKNQDLNWEERLNHFEHWVNENKKVLTYVVGGLFAVVAAYLAFTKYILNPKLRKPLTKCLWLKSILLKIR